MEENAVEVLDVLAGAVILMLTISFLFLILSHSGDYDEVLKKDTGTRSSVTHSLAYGEDKILITQERILDEIRASLPHISIQIDTNTLTEGFIAAFKDNDISGENQLRNLIGTKKYQKVTCYNSQGKVTQIKYISD